MAPPIITSVGKFIELIEETISVLEVKLPTKDILVGAAIVGTAVVMTLIYRRMMTAYKKEEEVIAGESMYWDYLLI